MDNRHRRLWLLFLSYWLYIWFNMPPRFLPEEDTSNGRHPSCITPIGISNSTRYARNLATKNVKICPSEVGSSPKEELGACSHLRTGFMCSHLWEYLELSTRRDGDTTGPNLPFWVVGGCIRHRQQADPGFGERSKLAKVLATKRPPLPPSWPIPGFLGFLCVSSRSLGPTHRQASTT